MGEEKIFLEGNRAEGNAAAPAAASVQSESVFDVLSKKFRGLFSDDPPDAAPPEPPEPPLPAPSEQSSSSSPSSSSPTPLEQKVIDEALKKCFDPEIPVNIYELGLIYSVNVSPDGVALVKMTLTAPACPVAGSLPGEVEQKIKAIPGITDAKVELVWEPPWTPEMMSRVAKVVLGM